MEMNRYSRQIRFQPIGTTGQEKIRKARIACVGAGALGCVIANHLVRAGIGFLRIIDRDIVEITNLQRQMLFDELDAEQQLPKAEAAKIKLEKVNREVEIEAVTADLNSENAESLLSDVDLIIDGTDNFHVRYLVNDTAVKHRIPWIYGGVITSTGSVMMVIPEKTPCLACMFPEMPGEGAVDTCDTAGVIGPAVHMVASLQVTEALKYITDNLKAIRQQMWHFDIWENQWSTIDISRSRKSDCAVCQKREFPFLNAQADTVWFESLCGRNTVQIQPVKPMAKDFDQLYQSLSTLGKAKRTPYLIKFQPDDELTLMLFPDGRALVQGTDDITRAKNVYSRYIGM